MMELAVPTIRQIDFHAILIVFVSERSNAFLMLKLSQASLDVIEILANVEPIQIPSDPFEIATLVYSLL